MPAKIDTNLQDSFIQQYEVNLAQLHKTCADLGISHDTILRWRKESTDFDSRMQKVQDLLSERVEKSLIELALDEEKPNIVAKIFYLKNNWTDKYGERPMERAGEPSLWFEAKQALPAPKEENVTAGVDHT